MSVKEHYQKKTTASLKLGFGLTVLLLGLIVLATVVMFVSLTQNSSKSANAEDQSDSNHQSTRASRSEKKLVALEFQKKMLEKEQALRDKYEHKRRAKMRYDKPDQEKAYRAWRDQKERNSKHLSRFKNDRTKNPASVKVQLMKSAARLSEDRPQR